MHISTHIQRGVYLLLYFRCVGCPTPKSRQAVKDFNKVLKFVGVKIIMGTSSLDQLDEQYYFDVTISVEEGHFYNFLNSGFGRPGICLHEFVTLDEVNFLLESNSSEEVAGRFGISRATFFRRLKDMRSGKRIFL